MSNDYMTKIKIAGQNCDLEDLPEVLRDKIIDKLNEEGIKYDDNRDHDESEIFKRINIVDDKKRIKGSDRQRRKKKICIQGDKEKNISLYRKMFGYYSK